MFQARPLFRRVHKTDLLIASQVFRTFPAKEGYDFEQNAFRGNEVRRKQEEGARSDAAACSRISCGCVSASVNEIGGKSLDLSTIGTGSSRKDPAVSAFTDSYIYRL